MKKVKSDYGFRKAFLTRLQLPFFELMFQPILFADYLQQMCICLSNLFEQHLFVIFAILSQLVPYFFPVLFQFLHPFLHPFLFFQKVFQLFFCDHFLLQSKRNSNTLSCYHFHMLLRAFHLFIYLLLKEVFQDIVFQIDSFQKVLLFLEKELLGLILVAQLFEHLFVKYSS